MKVAGLLCYYDEQPVWLAGLVASLVGVVDQIIAVDGAYALYPGAMNQPASRAECAQAIHEIAANVGIAATVVVPNEPWTGNETEKRTRLFQLAALDLRPRDWLLVIDGDETVGHASSDFHVALADLDDDVATVGFRNVDDPEDRYSPVRRLFRNLPGLHVEGAHYVYRAGDGRYLWGREDLHKLEPATDLSPLLGIAHRKHSRNPSRLQAAAEYQQMRDSLGVERLHTYSIEEAR